MIQRLKKIWFALQTMGIDRFTPTDEKDSILFINRISLFNVVTISINIVIYLFQEWLLCVLLLPCFLGFLSNFYLNKKHKYDLAKLGTFIFSLALIVIFTLFLGKGSGLLNSFFIQSILPFLLFGSKEKRKRVWFVLISVCAFLILYTLVTYYPTVQGLAIFSDQEQFFIFLPITTIVFILLILFIHRLTSNQEKTLNSFVRMNEQMALKEEHLKRQIEENKIQMSEIEKHKVKFEKAFEDLQGKNDQLESQEKAMEQALLELNETNLKLHQSELQLEEIVEQRTAKIAKQHQVLENSYQVLDEQTRALREGILYAKRLQNAILPPTQIIQALFRESFVFYQPRDIVSGDFYWINRKLDKEGNMLVALAAIDCTGHGVPGAIMSMIGYSLLNQYVSDVTLSNPEILVQKLHEGIIQALKQRQNENNDGMDLALCVYNSAHERIDFVGAKNPLIYIQENQLHEIKGANLSLGGSIYANNHQKLVKHTIDVSKPTTLYIYSDGFQDQFGGPKGRKFMKTRFKKLLLAHHHKPMDEQGEIFESTFNEWKKDEEQVDDVLLIGFKVG